MTSLFKVIIFILCLPVIILFALGIGLYIYGECCIKPNPPPPTEQQITDVFKKNTNTLIKLKDMINNDIQAEQSIPNLKTLAVGTLRSPSSYLSQEKISNYLKLLKIAGISQIGASIENNEISEYGFTIFSEGMVFSGCSTEIIYINKGEPFKPEWANPYKVFKLEDNWYGQTMCN